MGVYALGAGFLNAHADEVDDFIQARMLERHLTGLSLAIVQDGKIIKARGYGFADDRGQKPVTPATLFQAGSISKPLAALAALRLVQTGQLSLDADVNTRLRAWKVPENEFTKDQKVTLRGILSHSAGLTVHGYPGYALDAPVPALVEVLNGVQSANTSAIRVDVVPGSKWRYSGGGYTVLQQMIIDATGKPFPEFMAATVLTPLGMTNSTYDQPLPPKMAAVAAAGYLASGQAVKGGWHVYPEMAAAGLWTTASDLARFAIGIQRALAGDANPVLSQAMTRQMLAIQNPTLSDTDGLGLFVRGSGDALRFWHDGRNEGFDALMMAFPNTGKGAVIMINANDNRGTMADIIKAIAKQYAWRTF
jgi:CubicO group peptidase (beta-lactamase class C family)